MQDCKVEGCGRLVWAAGYCSKHYNRLRTKGTLEDGPRARAPLAERLWKKIRKGGPDECWPFVGKDCTSGYGFIGLGGRDKGKGLVHRVVWELTYGPIPKGAGHHGMVVMHKCDNSLCCNPSHLRLGKQSDNVKDMDSKGRRINAQLAGEKHHNSKLTERDVRAIRAASGTNVEIARRFGITRQNVRYIRTGVAWRHVK
jgi:DNA-binding CsgD family transcriptional regulator